MAQETLRTKDAKQAKVLAKPVMMKFDRVLAQAKALLVEHPSKTYGETVCFAGVMAEAAMISVYAAQRGSIVGDRQSKVFGEKLQDGDGFS